MYNFDVDINRQGTGAIKLELRDKIFGNSDVLPLWVADMDFETPEFIRAAIEKRLKHPIFGYTIRQDSYYDSIVNWMDERHGWKIQKDWILFSPGIVPALNFSTLAYTNPADTIIVQPPVYFPFFTAVKDHNRVLAENQLVKNGDSYCIDFDELRAMAADASMMLLSNPHNPVGRVWSEDELRQIGEICLENNVIIISDEIHSDLILPGYKHVPMASVSDDIADITVTCIAPSKTFNIAGLATSSVIISNKLLRNKFEGIVEKLHLAHGNLFGAVASEAGYIFGADWVDELMLYVKENYNLLRKLLNESDCGINLIKPEATYLAWLDFSSTGLSDNEIKNLLVNEAKVGLSHGPDFGKGGESFQRMNLASPRNIIKQAVEKIISVNKFSHNVK